MNIDSITNGIVLDHITAGRSMEVYHYLNLDRLNCSIAIIKNVKSNKMGRKDIIKIDETIDINLDILGYLDPNISVSIIRNEKCVEKFQLALPEQLENVISCKNPRCITSVEPDADQLFYLADSQKQLYRCRYCDTAYK